MESDLLWVGLMNAPGCQQIVGADHCQLQQNNSHPPTHKQQLLNPLRFLYWLGFLVELAGGLFEPMKLH